MIAKHSFQVHNKHLQKLMKLTHLKRNAFLFSGNTSSHEIYLVSTPACLGLLFAWYIYFKTFTFLCVCFLNFNVQIKFLMIRFTEKLQKKCRNFSSSLHATFPNVNMLHKNIIISIFNKLIFLYYYY